MAGFVYIWRDRLRKRFYIGSHWGRLEDGYVCSSVLMKRAYKRRPGDFRRRVLETVETSRACLLDAEDRWLAMIKPQELGGRYYNVRNVTNHYWHTEDATREATAKKLRARKTSPETLAKWRESWYARERTRSPEIRAKVSASLKGRPAWGKCGPMEQETKAKISAALKGRIFSEETKVKIRTARAAQIFSPETRAKISASLTGKKTGPQSADHLRKRVEAFKATMAARHNAATV